MVEPQPGQNHALRAETWRNQLPEQNRAPEGEGIGVRVAGSMLARMALVLGALMLGCFTERPRTRIGYGLEA